MEDNRPPPRKRPVVPLAPDADLVLRKCRKLRESLRNNNGKRTDDDDDDDDETNERGGSSGMVPRLPEGVPSDIVEVAELPAEQVLEGMEALAIRIAQQVLNRQCVALEIPSRASSNQIYVKEWDRIVLGGKKSTRSFLNVKESRKTAITIRVMQLLHAGM